MFMLESRFEKKKAAQKLKINSFVAYVTNDESHL